MVLPSKLLLRPPSPILSHSGRRCFFQLNRDESELFTNSTVAAYNASRYNQFLSDNFANWGANTGSVLASNYAAVTNASVTRSYYDLQTDIGLYCAYVQLLKSAAIVSGDSNYYLSVVMQPPSSPVQVNPSGPSPADPFHLWDFMAATPSWNYFRTNGGSIYTPGGAAVPGYTPSTQDTALGKSLQKQILSFISTGAVSGVQSFNSRADFPDSYLVSIQGDAQRTAAVSTSVNYRQSYCDSLSSLNLFNADGRYWWVN